MKAGGKQSSAYSSTLKMEAICSAKTSVEFQWATQRYITDDSTLQIKMLGMFILMCVMKWALRQTASLREVIKGSCNPDNSILH
jgi:hypothetical protein